jgi:hypothetical protein
MSSSAPAEAGGAYEMTTAIKKEAVMMGKSKPLGFGVYFCIPLSYL